MSEENDATLDDLSHFEQEAQLPHDFSTLSVHAGQEIDSSSRSRAVPIYATASFAFDSADHATRIFAGQETGNQYGRMHNPTVETLTKRLVALEAGEAGVSLSSGQAATTVALMTLTYPGAHLVVSSECFGGTFSLLRKILEPYGVEVSIVPPEAEAIKAALTPQTVGVWVETIANPSGTVPDIAAIAGVCQDARVPFLVDNTWGCGGYLCQPLVLGADVVVHSTTKWIGGHGTFIGGAIVDAGRFDFEAQPEKFPAFHKPDARGRTYLTRAPGSPFGLRAYDLGLFTMGMTLSPYAAALALQGLETLPLRVQRSCDTTLELARWLETLPQVKRVIYPGLASHPSYEVAKRTLTHGFGAVLAFEAQDLQDAKAFLDRVQLATHLANIGDAKTVVINPWTTTHQGLSEDARRQAGVTPELIRVSVGLEHPEDLKRDFAQALGVSG